MVQKTLSDVYPNIAPKFPFQEFSKCLKTNTVYSCRELVGEAKHSAQGRLKWWGGTMPELRPYPPGAPLLCVIVLTEGGGLWLRGFTWGKPLPIMSGRLGI